jgi:hypothetical protein
MMLRRSGWFAVAVTLLVPVAACAQGFPLVREMEVDGQKIIIDNTNTRLSIEVVDEFEDLPQQAGLARKLFKSYTDAQAAAEGAGAYLLPSVALVYAKGKKFDDGMYAAVELAAEGGFGELAMGKRAFVERVLKALEERHGSLSGYAQEACEVAMSYVASALKAGGQLEGYEFPGVTLHDDVGRKPIGFYTWSDELFSIFRRDTALQERFALDDAPQIFTKGKLSGLLLVAASAVLADAVASDQALLAEYERLNGLYARLTNPLNGLLVPEVMAAVAALGGLDSAISGEQQAQALVAKLEEAHKVGLALFQPSRSKEMALLWEAAALGLSSMDEFIRAIRQGDIDLEPDEESGWYEYQQYALEPLLLPDKMPEGEKLKLGEKYRKLLEEHFKSMISQIRETHVKALEVATGEEELPLELEVEIVPYLAVEPIGTTYLRFADAYGFLNSVLMEHLGPEALSKLHVRDEGAVEREPALGDELEGVKRLMEGAHLLTCRDIGVEPELEGTTDELMSTLQETDEWLASWTDDPDMQRDVRMMIQVSESPDAFWAVIGVKLTKLEVSFQQRPAVRAADPQVQVDAYFDSATYWVPTEKFIEVQFEGDPLNREEFRALCDREKTEARIMSALEGEGATPAPSAQVAPAQPRRLGIWRVAGVLVVLAVIALIAVKVARRAA